MTSTSVVIPCYNVQDYLPEALDSVKRQTVPVQEIILVDDGSEAPIRSPDGWDGPPLRIVRTENRGLPAARNLGIAHCSAPFVAFLDADDAWEPRKIELQERALAADARAVASYTHCVNRQGFFGFGPYPPPNVSDDEFLLVLWYNLFFPPSCVLVRRDALTRVGAFREDLGNGEDIELWLRLLTLGSFAQVSEPLCFYRQHPNQFTKNIYKKMIGSKQSRAAMIAQHADRLVRAGIPRNKLWDSYRNDVLLVYYRREFAAARRLLRNYWWEHPRDWKMLVYSLVSLLPVRLVTLLRGQLSVPATAAQTKPARSPGREETPGLPGWDLAFARIKNALAH
jgi:glycosyltransferase involved in cell wall biosynthesis